MTAPRDEAPRVGERALARGVTATWWYTASGVLLFGTVMLGQWLLWLPPRFADGDTLWRLVAGSVATALALAAVAVLLGEYRPNVLAVRDDHRVRVQPGDLLGLTGALVAAVLLAIAVGSWLAGASILAYALSVRAWMPGVRWRLIAGLTAVLIAVWIAEAPAWSALATGIPVFFLPAMFTVLLPLTCGSSLWWWDIVLELDRARRAESDLAATRERLRLAHDVHDLQGHHLQVIALQLELAQRLMARDPEAAEREITRARTAVDAARQGTRDLAARFRGVPLADELENAADLLRSAGLEIESRVDADVTQAPAELFGPIVRESVTNVLKHGEGTWAKLSLGETDGRWVYRISNDDAGHDDVGWGSGLDGMAERAEAVGGEVAVRRESGAFELTVSLPAGVPA